MVKAARSSLYKFKLVTTMLAGRVYFLIFINDEDPDSRQAYRKSLLEHSATITYDPADPALLLAGNHILVCNASATTPIVLSTLLRRQPSEHAALNAWGMTFENGSKFKRDVSGPSVRRIEIMQAVLGVVAGAPTETDVLVVRNDLQLAAYHAWRRNPSITAHLATFSNADIAARLAARKNQGRSGGKGQSGKSQGGRGKQQSAGSNKKAAGGQRGAAGSAPSQQVVLAQDQTQSASEVVINNAQPVAGQDVGAETSGKASTSSVKPQLPVQSCRITSSPSRTIANGKAKQKTVDTATDESSGTASTTSASVPKPRVARNAGKVFKASSSVSATTVSPSSNKRLPADTEDSGPVKKPKHAEALSQHDAVAQESKGDGVVDKSRGADEQVQQVDDVTLDLPAAGLGGDANGIEGGLRADTVTEARVLETETA